jgi:uncharacterized membrane protein
MDVLAIDVLQIVLRIVHIGAGIFWVGSVAFLTFFLQPAVGALGSQGGAVMGFINDRQKLPAIIGASALLTMAAGIWLYWRESDGFDGDWISSDVGIAFTVGAIAAIIVFVLSIALVRPMTERMRSLAVSAEGAPSPQQAHQIATLQRKMRGIALLNMLLLIVAVIAMVSAENL